MKNLIFLSLLITRLANAQVYKDPPEPKALPYLGFPSSIIIEKPIVIKVKVKHKRK